MSKPLSFAVARRLLEQHDAHIHVALRMDADRETIQAGYHRRKARALLTRIGNGGWDITDTIACGLSPVPPALAASYAASAASYAEKDTCNSELTAALMTLTGATE